MSLISFDSQISKNQPTLKYLLYILTHLSQTQPVNSENYNLSTHHWNINFNGGNQVESITFQEVSNLSDLLFTELHTTFKESATTKETIESSTLLLRCCLKITSLLSEIKQDLALQHSKSLLTILLRLIHTTNENESFIWKGLEVFIDEILVNKLVRDLLYLVDSMFSSRRLFSKHDKTGVIEMVCAHFVISTTFDSKMNRMYVERLCWEDVNAFRTPLISLCAAVSLLHSPTVSSLPMMVQAYVVLLASDVIGVYSLDLQLIDRYIDAFEKSVVLYTRIMSKGENPKPTSVAFEQLLVPSTLEKVNRLTMNLKESWGEYRSKSEKRGNNELVAYSVEYAKVSLCLFDNAWSENMLSILGCVIMRASSEDVLESVLRKYNESSMEDLYMLASTLKLMCCSMLQAVKVLRNSNRRESEYKAVMDVVQRFQQFSVDLPGQSFLSEKMESHRNEHVKSKWMLMHFSGLLSVSYALKLDFLVKNSVFGMVVSLYLFILEGGDLEALTVSVCNSESLSSSIPSSGYENSEASSKAEETAVNRKKSETLALTFQKTRTLYLGKKTKDTENGLDSGVGVEEETCNGEEFLRCMAGKEGLKSGDVEDLADFIVCEPGKDYAAWMKNRQRFREQKWKADKIASQRWQKKQKAWRESKGRVFKS